MYWFRLKSKQKISAFCILTIVYICEKSRELSIYLIIKDVLLSVTNKARCRSVYCVLVVLEISPTYWCRKPGTWRGKTRLGNNICSKDTCYSFTKELDAGKAGGGEIAITRRRSGVPTIFWDAIKTAKCSAFKTCQPIC